MYETIYGMKTLRQKSFVVTVQYPAYLEDTVVKNYVNAALKKYDKVVQERGRADSYFDVVRPYVRFSVSGMVDADKGNLRELIVQINSLEKHFESVEMLD